MDLCLYLHKFPALEFKVLVVERASALFCEQPYPKSPSQSWIRTRDMSLCRFFNSFSVSLDFILSHCWHCANLNLGHQWVVRAQKNAISPCWVFRSPLYLVKYIYPGTGYISIPPLTVIWKWFVPLSAWRRFNLLLEHTFTAKFHFRSNLFHFWNIQIKKYMHNSVAKHLQ